MGTLHRCSVAPTPPGEPLPERTPLTERAEGKQEVDEKKPQHSWEADFTDCFPTGLGVFGPRTGFQLPSDPSVWLRAH